MAASKAKNTQPSEKVPMTTVNKIPLRTRLALMPKVTVDPRTYPRRQKTVISIIVSIASMLSGFCSTVYLPGVAEVTRDLDAPDIAITLTLSLFILFMGVAPIFYSSISDAFHIRRIIYLCAFILFIVASAACAVVTNVWVLVVLRILQSSGASAGIAVGGGTIADLFEVKERGTPLGMLTAGAALGPLVGPVIGGVMTSTVGWRSTFWLSFSLGVLMLILVLFFVPETFRDEEIWGLGETADDDDDDIEPASPLPEGEVLGEEIELSETITTEGSSDDTINEIGNQKAHETPKKESAFGSLAYLRLSFVLIPCVCAGLVFAMMFTFETLMSTIFEEVYGLNSTLTGFTFLGGGLFNIVGAVTGGKFSDYWLRRCSKKRAKELRSRGGQAVTSGDSFVQTSTYLPEDRITPITLIGVFIILPLGTLLFGWSIWAKISLAFPIIGFGLVCFVTSESGNAVTSYLVDALPGRGSTATSVMMFVRMVFSCILSVTASPLKNALGVEWIGVIFAALAIIVSGCGFAALLIRGGKMRSKSPL